MTDVLIRDVPGDDLDQIRTAATAAGTSLQGYLRTTVAAQADYLRRQQALAAAARRLEGRPGVRDDDRAAVLEAVADEHHARADALGGRERQHRPR